MDWLPSADNIFTAEFDDSPNGTQGSGDAWQVMSYFHIYASDSRAARLLYDFDRLE